MMFLVWLSNKKWRCCWNIWSTWRNRHLWRYKLSIYLFIYLSHFIYYYYYFLKSYLNFQVNDPDNNDLRVYYNLWLKRETVKNCAIMIYPRFVGKFDNLILSSQATLIESLKEGCKSVFDDYFHIYIYYGETKNSKRKRNRHGKKTQVSTFNCFWCFAIEFYIITIKFFGHYFRRISI